MRVELERRNERPFGEDHGQCDEPVFLVLWPPLLGLTQREPSRREVRMRLFSSALDCGRHNPRALFPRVLQDPFA
jgi:hypothetical protein